MESYIREVQGISIEPLILTASGPDLEEICSQAFLRNQYIDLELLKMRKKEKMKKKKQFTKDSRRTRLHACNLGAALELEVVVVS